MQSVFFKLFGVNWNAYVFHSSIFNFFVSLIVFFFFYNLKLEKIACLFFTCCFSVLAYTISGTPFVDHHATFFLLIGTFFLVQGFYYEKSYIWFLAIFFYFLSFFTKQVPASYVIILQGLIICIYLFNFKKIKILTYIIFSTLILTLAFVILLFFLNIDFKSFFIQYLDYPRSIGDNRLTNFKFSAQSFFNNYKFIFAPLILLSFILLSKIKKDLRIFYDKNIYVYLILLSFVVCLIFHQIMTKNQIYIYFLIPILFGVLYSELKFLNFKYKRFTLLALIVSLIFITSKYHYRFNENRKFHELEKTNLSNAVTAKKINKSLDGLLWINPFFEGTPAEEIKLLNDGILQLEREKEEIMLITHYLFLDSITQKNLNYPNRAFTTDGTSMPLKGNKYYEYYKNFLLKIIKSKEIKKIYFFVHESLPQDIVTNYIDKDCLETKKDEIFYILKLRCNK